ncbi:MAG: hypothetical protein QOI12_131 [Alphaproteobacteria bacterium]|jgi:hypothetical protein|nr:hypothetical protein [Alphaproteobacteria bacterium]
MNQHSHQTAPTQFVEAKGIRFAYRCKTGGMQTYQVRSESNG